MLGVEGVGGSDGHICFLVSLRAILICLANDISVSQSSSYGVAPGVPSALCAKRLIHSLFHSLFNNSDHVKSILAEDGRELLSLMKLATSCGRVEPGRVGSGSPFFLAWSLTPLLFKKPLVGAAQLQIRCVGKIIWLYAHKECIPVWQLGKWWLV